MTDEPAKLVDHWVKKNKVQYPIVILDAYGGFEEFLGVTGFPFAAVIDPERLWEWGARTALGVIGAFSAVEFVVRKIHFRHYEGGIIDRAFAWVFPAEKTELGRRSQAYIEQVTK